MTLDLVFPYLKVKRLHELVNFAPQLVEVDPIYLCEESAAFDLELGQARIYIVPNLVRTTGDIPGEGILDAFRLFSEQHVRDGYDSVKLVHYLMLHRLKVSFLLAHLLEQHVVLNHTRHVTDLNHQALLLVELMLLNLDLQHDLLDGRIPSIRLKVVDIARGERCVLQNFFERQFAVLLLLEHPLPDDFVRRRAKHLPNLLVHKKHLRVVLVSRDDHDTLRKAVQNVFEVVSLDLRLVSFVKNRLAIRQDGADHIKSYDAVHKANEQNREPLDFHLPVLVKPDAKVHVEHHIREEHLKEIVAHDHRKEKYQTELVHRQHNEKVVRNVRVAGNVEHLGRQHKYGGQRVKTHRDRQRNDGQDQNHQRNRHL